MLEYKRSQEQPKEPKARKQPTKPRTSSFWKRYQEYVETGTYTIKLKPPKEK